MNDEFENWFKRVRQETDDAFQTVGTEIRARVNVLCNEAKFDDAKELDNAYNVINKYFGNKLDFKMGDKK